MKFYNIKSLISAASILFAAGTLSTSCVSDLDVDPINPQQTMEADYDALFNKIYASFALTGQTGPDGNKDLTSFDEGQSDFYRMAWYMNEFTTDEAHWIWATDAGVPDVLHNTYGATNDFSMGLYYRCYFTITLCNFYLDQVADDDTEETTRRRAEVRFIRALNYYYLMDNYGNAAFIEHVSSEKAEYYTRDQFFTYVESELKVCEADMAEAGQNTYGRVDKVAAQLLLARMYLNARVYLGLADDAAAAEYYDNAMSYAEMVINNGYYHLNTTGATNPATGEQYTAYQMLFLADNDTNGAQYEAIFPVMFDGLNTQSHGGMNFLILSCYSSTMSETVPSGTDNSWGKCTRVRGKLIDTFFGEGVDAPETGNVLAMTTAAGDDRALFYSQGYTCYITDESEAAQGYSCVKFRNVRSDGKATAAIVKVDTDLPLLRVAEAYLTYAEADTRKNGVDTKVNSQDTKIVTSKALTMIKKLRDRAQATMPASMTLLDICDEWSKEFWFEGRRRMDLVRFGRYGGQSSYKWEFMGGIASGAQFPAFRNVYPLPDNDLTNNLNLKQNTGY